MSTLGKILTVLVVLVAVGVAVSVTIAVVLTDDYKALYMAQKDQNQTALGQRDQALKDLEAEKKAWATDRGLKEMTIASLEATVKERDNTIKDKDAQRENQEARLATLAGQYTGLNAQFALLTGQLKEAQQARDDAMQQRDKLSRMNSELSDSLNITTKNLDSCKEQLRQTADGLAAAEGKLAFIKQYFPDVKLPDSTPVFPTEKIRGLVVQVDNEAKIVTINLGEDDGVVPGMKFFIYNGAEMKYLATLVVTQVQKSSAAGTLEVIRNTVKVNDHVTNRFE